MKNIPAFLFSIALVIAVGVGFSSCKDDDPPAKPRVSFAETEITVNEDDGILEIEVVLDRAYSKDLRIDYELGGTASDQDVVGTATADYEVVGDHGVVEIEAGETRGVIELDIYSDAGFESDETIEVALIDTNTDEVILSENNETVITLKNDDEQITASFTATTMTVNESDGAAGFIQIAVQLDKTPTQDVTIKYTLAGTADDSLSAYWADQSGFSDYYVNGDTTELVVPAGQSSGNIELRVYTDFMFEDDETIIITLVESSDVKPASSNKEMTITLEQQNGKAILLLWDKPAYTDVDMDLWLWAGEDVENFDLLVTLSANAGTSPKAEAVFIPSEVTGGVFGLSHNYYSGSADPLTFEVHFIDFTDGVVEPLVDREVFTATYTAVNKNPWEETQTTPPVVQTFSITDGVYGNITQITVPTSGSRIRTPEMPKGTKRRFQPVKPI